MKTVSTQNNAKYKDLGFLNKKGNRKGKFETLMNPLLNKRKGKNYFLFKAEVNQQIGKL